MFDWYVPLIYDCGAVELVCIYQGLVPTPAQSTISPQYHLETNKQTGS